MKDKKKVIGIMLMIAGMAFLAFMSFNTFKAINSLAADYHNVMAGDYTADTDLYIVYDDGFYGSIGFGANLNPTSSSFEAKRSAFIENALKGADSRIVSCGILYTMIAVSAMAYYMHVSAENDMHKYVLYTVVAVLGGFVAYMAVCIITHVVRKTPFYPPLGYDGLLLFASLMAVIAGMCAVGMLLRAVRYKLLIALIVIPVIFGLFIFSSQFECRLNMPDKIESFEYLRDKFEADSTAYYDEKANAMVIEGKYYYPEQTDNPDALMGTARAGAIAFETVNPFSGNGIFMTDEILSNEYDGLRVAPLVTLVYILKAIAWVMAALFIKTHKD